MEVTLYSGKVIKTPSGSIAFCNESDLRPVVRMYELSLEANNEIKAWQVHERESKWMRCTQGIIMVKTCNLKTLDVETYILDSNEFKWLTIPAGFANGIKPIKKGSKLLVGSDLSLIQAQNDNAKWPLEKVPTNWEII